MRQEYFQGIFGQNVTVNVINYYAGGSYETDQTGIVQADSSILINATVTRRYYAFAGQTVAMVECGPQGCGSGLRYFLTDHLGSVVAVVNASGGLISQQRYYPYGGVRSDVGTVTQTDFGYTGQRNLDAQGNSYRLGLMDYKARFYDAYLHHFIQPDTLTPGGPQGLNRYAYSINNPINYTDPSGNMPIQGCGDEGKDACAPTEEEVQQNIAAAAYFNQQTEEFKCEAGDKNYCSQVDKVAIETVGALNSIYNNAKNHAQNAADTLDIVGFGLDLLEKLGVEVPSPASYGLSATQQGLKDLNQHNSPGEELARVTVSVLEGAATTVIAGSAAATVVTVGGGPENLTADWVAFISFAAFYAGTENSFERANNELVFPLIKRLIP